MQFLWLLSLASNIFIFDKIVNWFKVNPISAEIANRSRYNDSSSNKPIWESLYKLNQEKKVLQELKQKEAEENKIKSELNYSYKPQINTDYHLRDPRTSLYERSQMYSRSEKEGELNELKIKCNSYF